MGADTLQNTLPTVVKSLAFVVFHSEQMTEPFELRTPLTTMRISSGCAAADCECAMPPALVTPTIITIAMASANAKRLSFILFDFPSALSFGVLRPRRVW